MARLIISRADEAVALLAARGDIAAVLSITHPGAAPGRGAAPDLSAHGYGHVPQKVISFYDIEQDAGGGPDMRQVEEGIRFVMDHLSSGPVLIHCHAGKSRSAAVALGVLALVYPDRDAAELVSDLLSLRPIAAPNILVTAMADTLAGRGGRLTAAVEAHPEISARRALAQASRLALLRRDPALHAKIFPEKRPKP